MMSLSPPTRHENWFNATTFFSTATRSSVGTTTYSTAAAAAAAASLTIVPACVSDTIEAAKNGTPNRVVQFLIFLESVDIEPTEQMSHDCAHQIDECNFAAAEQCILNELASWQTFVVYVPFACALLTVALFFNVVSIIFVAQVRHKFPRHVLLQSLSSSDTLLSALTLLKRSADFLPERLVAQSIKMKLLIYGNMIWQAAWLISAFGLLMLALDCFFATSFPFAYEKPTTRIIVVIGVVCLWLLAFVFTGLLVYLQLSYSGIVQYIVCGLMFLILLVVVAGCCYAFSLTERIRRQQMQTLRDDKTLRHVRKSRLKSSITIAIIMTSSFVSWLPLVVYFSAVDEDFHLSNAKLSHWLLIVCLLCFHINAIANPVIYSLRFKDVRAKLRRRCAQHRLLMPLAALLDDPRDPTSLAATAAAASALSRGVSGQWLTHPSVMATVPRQTPVLDKILLTKLSMTNTAEPSSGPQSTKSLTSALKRGRYCSAIPIYEENGENTLLRQGATAEPVQDLEAPKYQRQKLIGYDRSENNRNYGNMDDVTVNPRIEVIEDKFNRLNDSLCRQQQLIEEEMALVENENQSTNDIPHNATKELVQPQENTKEL